MILSRFSSLIFITIFVASFSWRPISGIIRRKTKSPLLWSRKPLNVKFGMYLESIANFRETEMSFDVDLYMYLSWRDPFLAHNKSSYILINDHSIRRQIWMPDLYFANARSARFHDVTIPNFSIFIAPDGTVAYSCRLTLTVACNLDLIHYPMDHQKCFIRILSYAYVASEMNVTWFQESPIRYNDEIELPEFIIEKVSNGYCNGTYRYAVMERSYKIGQFSCLEGNIHLRRSIGHNLVQSFIPTGLIVVISWVSFFIDRRAVPARVTLSFTTLLSLATIGNGLRFGLPQHVCCSYFVCYSSLQL
uniref:Neurotransmitter-gated ion-channel ligand-binding domain-containing protein n=1 Tax=Parascaris univalens TaxID=6257 RepID=A0A914ZNW3_PARUN